jgi:hypothetical protein
MEDNIDKITKELLSNSRLELSNPMFNSEIMAKIAVEADRKLKRKIYLSFLFIAVIILSAAFLVIRIFNIDPLHPALNPGKFPGLSYLIIILEGILRNEYLILPLILLLGIRKFIDTRKAGYSI